MQCPHLSASEGKKTCQRMLDLGMDGEVTDFDTHHFCEGNPVYCYFFRVSFTIEESQEREVPKVKIGRLFKNASHGFEAELRP